MKVYIKMWSLKEFMFLFLRHSLGVPSQTVHQGKIKVSMISNYGVTIIV
ncbi:MAG: hypothetical protein ACON5F_14945 [Jejuia sp.]